MTIRHVAAAVVIGVATVLFGCGGGGGGDNTTTTSPSSNWDSMLWDQGNWG